MTALVDAPRRRRAILLGVCLALMVVVASVSGLNVAQPQPAVELGAAQDTAGVARQRLRRHPATASAGNPCCSPG